MKNAITYIASKNKTMVYITSLTNRISCVVGIYIFGFKKYWNIVFNLMELNMVPTLNCSFKPKKSTPIEKTIITKIQCKNNKSLSQGGNAESENLQNILAR